MADTKNYGLKGVGDDVQFGKAGPRINLDTGSFEARNATDAAYVNFRVLDPVVDADAATKAYVDNVAAGLDPKESCRCATTANIGTYNSSGGAAGNGQLTSVPATIDGVTLAEGDRVLVKNQSTATQNGIYVVTATTTTLDRATDHDSNAEVSAGNFTFIEEGTTNADSGWVLQGPDPLTINTSNLNWVLFSTSSDIVAGTGLAKTGNVLDLDFSELASVAVDTLTGTDEIIVQDGTAESRITVDNFVDTFDIPHGLTTNGITVRTAADTYTSRSVVASAVAGDEGISVVQGDGVAGNITIGVDIIGQTSLATVETGDELLISDANASSANKRVTVDALKTFMNAGTSSTSITEGDSTLSIADSGTGVLTANFDGTDYWTSQASGTSFEHKVDFTVDSATTNADIPVLRITSTSTGTPAAGIGPSIEFESETSAGAPGNLEVGGLIALAATDVTATSEDFDFVFQLMAGGAAAAEVARITSTGGFTGATATLSSLTNNDVLIAGTAGLIEDSGGLVTFDGTTFAITGALTVDEITIDGDTISNNTTDQPLILRPNGTGSIIFQNGSSEEILELNDTVSAVNGLAITAGATGNPAQITTGTGSEANIDIGFLTNGTGVLSVTAGSGNYEDNVTADDDIPNKKYVDDAIAATGGSGTVDTVTGTVDLTSATAQNIGPAAGIPAGATVLSVLLDVTVASDAVTTVTVGRSGAAASYMAATENDPEVTGIYIADGRTVEGSAQQAQATVATAGTVGSATCIITFRHA